MSKPRWHSPTVAQEQTASLYFERLRWGDYPYCPRCGNEGTHLSPKPHGRQRLWYCPSCQQQSTVRTGTFLARSRVPLWIWYRAARLQGRPEAVSVLRVECGVCMTRAYELLREVREHRGQLFTRDRPTPQSLYPEYLIPHVGWRFRPYRKRGVTAYANEGLLTCTGIKKESCALHGDQPHIQVHAGPMVFCWQAWGFALEGHA